MLVWKTWRTIKKSYGMVESAKTYKVLLLLGFIPLFIAIDG